MSTPVLTYLVLYTTLIVSTTCPEIYGQPVNIRPVTIQREQVRLGDVLTEISAQNGVRLSYDSRHLNTDSLVNVDVRNASVQECLEQIFGDMFEYRMFNNYVILKYAPLRMKLEISESGNVWNDYVISGRIIDSLSGAPIHQASVYEKNLLQSVLSDKHGNFKLHLKGINGPLQVAISKQYYRDLNEQV